MPFGRWTPPPRDDTAVRAASRSASRWLAAHGYVGPPQPWWSTEARHVAAPAELHPIEPETVRPASPATATS